MSADPIARFLALFEKAKTVEPHDATAMTLATADARGRPSARVVLLKSADARGFVFYTNRASRKGGQLAAHAKAGLCFYWKSLQRQVHIEGTVTQVSDAESDAYFATRPRGSQIGAWASRQSQPLENRAELEQRLNAVEQEYQGRDVPRPPHWGGYRVTPVFFEVWQEREFRLHDRIVYTRASAADAWGLERRNP